jgi:hypothetical protein
MHSVAALRGGADEQCPVGEPGRKADLCVNASAFVRNPLGWIISLTVGMVPCVFGLVHEE